LKTKQKKNNQNTRKTKKKRGSHSKTINLSGRGGWWTDQRLHKQSFVKRASKKDA